MPLSPESLFTQALEAGASDVHLVAGSPVLFRIQGTLTPQKETMTADSIASLIADILRPEQLERFTKEREMDTAYGLKDGTRLRINCHYEKDHMGLAARLIPTAVPTLADIRFEEAGMYFCGLEDGLVLFTGPTGTGKSTSLAAMIAHILHEKPVNVITLEDPIEFLFADTGKGVVRQRQFGTDFLSFPEALKHTLRQDPDVIMVGEMRDPETIAATLTLAETGHLVLATLHTPNAVQSITRIVDVFPAHQQNQIRSQLALSLRGVIAQRLLPRKDGGRVAQREVMTITPAVSNIIRENRLHELISVLQTGGKHGMCTFEQDRERLEKEGMV